jgi:hypothetical protein
LTRTFYEVSAVEEEDQKRHSGCGDNAEDGAVNVHWPLTPWRMRPGDLLQHRLFRREI